VVQAASIDEFYLDLSGTERLFHQEPLVRTAARLREEVLRRTGISVSVGGGSRRVIAKLATRRAKPAGVFVVEPGGELDFMKTLQLGDLPGVGPALAEALRRRGLVWVRDALDVQMEWLQRWFGQHRGAWLYRRIRGEDDTEVDPREGRKSISSERTFSRDLTSNEDLERRLLELSGSVASTLRQQGLRARTVTVKVRDADFTTRVHSRTVPEAVESDSAIFDVARGLFRELRTARAGPARLLGVGLSGLSDVGDALQLGLFDERTAATETERDRAVSQAVDLVRDRFGDDAVRPGRMLDGRAPGRSHLDEDEET
jgi:DNA polymerase-4